jgi:uncharacterized membrane protein
MESFLLFVFAILLYAGAIGIMKLSAMLGIPPIESGFALLIVAVVGMLDFQIGRYRENTEQILEILKRLLEKR